jgi:hypothetical protein
MLKLSLVIFVLISLVNSQFNNNNIWTGTRQCPNNSTDSFAGYVFDKCYYYAGVTDDWDLAGTLCGNKGYLRLYSHLKFYDDLDSLTKAYKLSNIWVLC